MTNNPEAFSQVQISQTRYEELKSRIELSEEEVATIYELFLGDEQNWPCPRCPRGQARKARFVRQVHLKLDDEGFPREEGFEGDVKRTFGLLNALGDPTGALVNRVFSALGVSGEPPRISARVYGCQEHGEFYLPLDEADAPMIGQLWLSRGGRLDIARLRFAVCNGLIETVDAGGTTLRVESCSRVLEWSGECEESGTGECSWTCPLHGTATLHADGSEEDSAYLLVRKVALG